MPNQYSKIRDVHHAQKPSILWGTLSGNYWRHRSMGETIHHATDDLKFKELQTHAAENLKLWEKQKIAPPHKVEVVHRDFGDVALEMTKKHGKIYPILNMANSLFPGGAALEGGSAQEESLWHRSSCVRSLLSTKGIFYDEKRGCFLYDKNFRNLVNGQEKMSPEELESLGRRLGIEIPAAYKVFIGEEPQVYFRGPEILFPTSLEDATSGKQFVADSALSYAFLPKHQIFPFFELRSAAPELVTRKIDSNDKEAVSEYTQDLSRRIAAQLDTLLEKGKTNAILGAWGCGSFKNDPELVARIYRKEIEKRAQHFQHLVFPIIDVENVTNFQVFKKYLDGLELGHLAEKTHSQNKTPYNRYSLYASDQKENVPSQEETKSRCTLL